MDTTKNVETVEKGLCHCPFCDNSFEMPYPFCQACDAQVRSCPVCGQALPDDAAACPDCA